MLGNTSVSDISTISSETVDGSIDGKKYGQIRANLVLEHIIIIRREGLDSFNSV
ncbi:MAG: hypothetical protein ACRD32_05450 [Nitrososphaerales archaeon]